MYKQKSIRHFIIPFVMFTSFFSFFSCKELTKKKQNIIEEWYEKKILIPENITFKSMGHDTVCSSILNHHYKVLVYVDSAGCTPCHLMLPEWKTYMSTCERLAYDVGFLFVVQSNNYRALEQDLYLQHFTYPIIYDSKNEFDKLNQFPKGQKYRTFLLDAKNHVVLIGSPIENIEISALFDKILRGDGDKNNFTK